MNLAYIYVHWKISLDVYHIFNTWIPMQQSFLIPECADPICAPPSRESYTEANSNRVLHACICISEFAYMCKHDPHKISCVTHWGCEYNILGKIDSRKRWER